MLREQKIKTIQIKEDDKHKREKPHQVHISEQMKKMMSYRRKKECKRDSYIVIKKSLRKKINKLAFQMRERVGRNDVILIGVYKKIKERVKR